MAHNHIKGRSAYSDKYVKYCGRYSENEDRYLELFKKGHSVSTAMDVHLMCLKEQYGEDFDLPFEINPNYKWVQRYYIQCVRIYTPVFKLLPWMTDYIFLQIPKVYYSYILESGLLLKKLIICRFTVNKSANT